LITPQAGNGSHSGVAGLYRLEDPCAGIAAIETVDGAFFLDDDAAAGTIT
jgi:hypothetical protein